ncbi:MAG: carcinine hydrolase/isopenicillin-N N-acyltransferase family protein, partial [Eubacteriales bacterium]|nr:carcinine hydrolase/isopenicillin-N N-acyltransferase family protein [Eubacteriales bacterium]
AAETKAEEPATEVTDRINVTKLTDYLYEVTMDDYEQYYDVAMERIKKRFNIGGCSSVQNGKIRGRNYDWTYDNASSFVVRVPAAEGRHASVGIAAAAALTEEQILAGEDKAAILSKAYTTLDGVNDAGLAININVVNYEEKGKFKMRTEDPSDDIFPIFVIRKVLDQAGTVEEALAMMDKMDVMSLGTEDEAHFMLSGKTSATDDTFKTVVVEYVPDAKGDYYMNVIENFVDDKPIMTNFHLTDFDGTVESLTPHPMGYERYLLLSKSFDQGNTVLGMADLMSKVYFTKNYDLYKDNFWYSEFSKNAGLTLKDAGEPNLNGDISRAGAYAEIVEKEVNNYLARSRDGGPKTWQTVHTSVIDCENKTLSVIPQEGRIAYTYSVE